MIRRFNPLLANPDRDYWRSAGNWRVRKARLWKRVARWSATIALHAAVGGVLVYAGLVALRGLSTTTEFAMTRVEVQGAAYISAESVRLRLASWFGRNLAEIDLDRIAAEVEQDRWIRQAAVKRLFPNALRVSIVERRPAALALIDGQPQIVDSTGYVIGPMESDPVFDLPMLVGFDGLRGEQLDQALARGVAAVDRLGAVDGNWLSQISEVDLSSSGALGLRLVEPGPRLLLDPERVERNLSAWLALRREIQGRIGPITQVDLRWRDRITVLPAVPLPELESR